MTAEPTSERLARELDRAGLPASMVEAARNGRYDEYKSPLAFPLIQLVDDLRKAGDPGNLVQRVMNGDFDCTKEESDAWAASPEGQAAFRSLTEGLGGEGQHGEQTS